MSQAASGCPPGARAPNVLASGSSLRSPWAISSAAPLTCINLPRHSFAGPGPLQATCGFTWSSAIFLSDTRSTLPFGFKGMSSMKTISSGAR